MSTPAPAPAPEPARPFNRCALAALGSIILFGYLGVPGLLFAYRARQQLRDSPGAERGARLAQVALVVAWLQTAALALTLVLVAFVSVMVLFGASG